MLKMTNDELEVLAEQVVECYPVSMIRDIQDWMETTKSAAVHSTLESVIDIIIDNTTFNGV